MNVKQNKNYFKKTDTLKYVGIFLMAICAIIFFVWSWQAYYIWVIGIPVGLVLTFVGSAGRSSDGDIDECIERACADIEVDLESDRHYAKRMLEHVPPFTVGEYEYDDGLMFKKAKNGKIRSSKYTRAMIYVLSDRLYISRRRIDLIADVTERDVFEIKYDTLSGIDVKREEKTVRFAKRSFFVKTCVLSMLAKNGEILRVPMADDVQLLARLETVKDVMLEYKKARAESS